MSNCSKAKWLDAWGLIYKKTVKLMWVKKFLDKCHVRVYGDKLQN